MNFPLQEKFWWMVTTSGSEKLNSEARDKGTPQASRLQKQLLVSWKEHCTPLHQDSFIHF
jgi:hypothetical protein